MADLSFAEKQILENLFEMSSGYVMDLSNRKFQELAQDATGLDIYSDKYKDQGTSKANLLRSFWQKESNHTVHKLLSALVHYWQHIMVVPLSGHVNLDSKFYQGAQIIIDRLKNDLSAHIDAIETNFQDMTFDRLKKSIIELIEKNRPDEAIDRLHTYYMMYIRKLLDKHGITANPNTALHSLLGLYKNRLMQSNIITAGMTEEILKSSASLLEKFNSVRNNQSLAHANQLLNYQESLLIFKVASSTIEFIESIEN